MIRVLSFFFIFYKEDEFEGGECISFVYVFCWSRGLVYYR